jgi:hypothetical protein
MRISSAMLEGAVQELEESAYCIELLGGTEVFTEDRLASLLEEVHELIAIFTACVNSVKSRKET